MEIKWCGDGGMSSPLRNRGRVMGSAQEARAMTDTEKAAVKEQLMVIAKAVKALQKYPLQFAVTFASYSRMQASAPYMVGGAFHEMARALEEFAGMGVSIPPIRLDEPSAKEQLAQVGGLFMAKSKASDLRELEDVFRKELEGE